jgi:hypothetical protein
MAAVFLQSAVACSTAASFHARLNPGSLSLSPLLTVSHRQFSGSQAVPRYNLVQLALPLEVFQLSEYEVS